MPTTRPISLASLACVLIAAAACTLTLSPTIAQPRPDAELSLESRMNRVNRAFKTLAKQINDPAQNVASLELLQTIQTHFVAAKVMVPERLNAAPAAERATMVKEFRTQAIKALAAFLELEQQLLNGENAKAAETLERIRAIQKKGHETFHVEEE